MPCLWARRSACFVGTTRLHTLRKLVRSAVHSTQLGLCCLGLVENRL